MYELAQRVDVLCLTNWLNAFVFAFMIAAAGACERRAKVNNK